MGSGVTCFITSIAFILFALISYFSFEYNTRSGNIVMVSANVSETEIHDSIFLLKNKRCKYDWYETSKSYKISIFGSDKL